MLPRRNLPSLYVDSLRRVLIPTLLVLFSAASAAAIAADTGPSIAPAVERSGEHAVSADRPAADEIGAPEAKIGPELSAIEEKAEPGSRVLVVVSAVKQLDLSQLASDVHWIAWPAGERVALLDVAVADLSALAALPGVESVEWGDPERMRPQPAPPDEESTFGYEPLDPALIRARLDEAPSWSRTAAALNLEGAASEPPAAVHSVALPSASADPARPRPSGWFDVGPGHGASEAWAMGYDGTGVRVAVLDTGVDYAHQDLQDTWAVLPEGHPYAGWPQVYDPNSMYRHVLDVTQDRDYGKTGYSGIITVYQESEVVEREVGGRLVPTACFQGLTASNRSGGGGRRLLDEACDFIVPESLSGVVRYGHHPDRLLYSLRADPGAEPPVLGEFVGVLLVDANTPGVYDTVYVDLDADHDFTNDKPVTKESPLAWRDVDGDTIADLSGGLLHFIADGELPVPVSYLWGLEEEIPEAGTLVAFYYESSTHGTQCASNVASRGRLGVPPEAALSFRDLPGDGRPLPLNPGMAQDASIVGVGNVYSGPSLVFESAWRYGVLGHDPDRPDDDIQVTTNSYGFSSADADGWDSSSRFLDYYVRHYNPNLAVLISTGNGGPGYGTFTAPAPVTGINVAASTQMGSTGWDSIYEASQITYGDVSSFSGRGPSADGRTGPHVAASGAYAGGAMPINRFTTNSDLPEERRSGAYAFETWGGTSRASPTAAGALALAYEAFRDRTGRWPKWDEARSLLMAGARYAAYDTFVMGAGVVDAGDAARIASGTHGVYALPSEWAAGSYRGESQPAFVKLARRGETHEQSITVANPGSTPVTVSLSGRTLAPVGSYEDELVTSNIAEEDRYNFNTPDYLVPVDRARLPDSTELMVVRAIHPLGELDTTVTPSDPDGRQSPDNNWRLGVWQHTDWNDNQKLWRDENSNGVVNREDIPNRFHGLEHSGWMLAIDWDNCELDQGEYERFSYHSGTTNNWEITVHHPLERWRDGIFYGLWHRTITTTVDSQAVLVGRTEEVPETHLRFRIDAYAYEDWDWLTTSQETLVVPPGATATFTATMRVPADAPPGAYQGAVFVDYDRGEGDAPVQAGGGYEIEHQRVVIPASVQVAADYEWEGWVTLGGETAEEVGARYDNGSVTGAFNWTWRPEAGDWRFFFVDARGWRPDTHWLLRTTWVDENRGQADIDTRLWGPSSDRFTDPQDPANEDESLAEPEWFGPHTMRLLARSPYRVHSNSRWPFDTSSNEHEDWIAAPSGTGLHEVMLHNVLFSGTQFEMPFETWVSSIKIVPAVLRMDLTGCGIVRVTPQMALPDFRVAGFGPRLPTLIEGAEVGQDDPGDRATASFRHPFTLDAPAVRIEVSIAGSADDRLDLYLFHDADGNGEIDSRRELVASSTGTGSEEQLARGGTSPAGDYEIWVHGHTLAAETAQFDLQYLTVYGEGLTFGDAPQELPAGETTLLQVCADPDVLGDEEDGPAVGRVAFGPGGAPQLFTVDVIVTRAPGTFGVHLPVGLKGWSWGLGR